VALYAFSFLDLAKLLGLQVPTVRKLVKRGALDPTDLESIALVWRERIARLPPAAALDPTAEVN
jgi:hypothetical protein